MTTIELRIDVTNTGNKPEIAPDLTEFGPLVKTEDGSFTIRHAGHGQDFHSLEGAKFEAWQLYVIASGYHLELVSAGDNINVLDVGMGLAYNACATIAAWIESDGLRSVQMTSLEVDLRLVEVIATGDAPWFKGWNPNWLAGPLALVRGSGQECSVGDFMAVLSHPKSSMTFTWRILAGDGNETLTRSSESKFDFIWQDPFTPELNPEMWSAAWFVKLFDFAQASARLMTYSVSRPVKDALMSGGWIIDKFKTPGRKRHWLRASKS